MEKLEVKNFLTISEASLEVKKINIIIGPQAKGKSVLAKLLYFFKHTFSQELIQSIENLDTKRELQKKCLASFEQIFPKYTWAHQAFSINYFNGDYHISITREKRNTNYTIKFDYCKKLNDFHRKLKAVFKDAQLEYDRKISEPLKKGARRPPTANDVLFERINSSPYSLCFNRSVFIPATRSFFANLQKNVFSFLASNIEIDPFIKEFGSRYESSKRVYENRHRFFDRSANDFFSKKLEKLTNEIAAGSYVYADEKDWIQGAHGVKTNLSNASSGQQESIPMLVILSIWPHFYGREKPGTFIIEEPEAHLFPISQKHIATLISTIHHEFNHAFFITTHSPYILTAFNNLIATHDAFAKTANNIQKREELLKIANEDETIRFEDVGAYTIESGKLISIIDQENRLIGASVLDEVSDHFDRAFDAITEIIYGDDE